MTNVTSLRGNLPAADSPLLLKQQFLDLVAQSIDEKLAEGHDLFAATAVIHYNEANSANPEASDPGERQPKLFTSSVSICVKDDLHLDYVYALSAMDLMRATSNP